MGTHGSDPYLGYHLFLSCCTFMHAGCTCQRSRSFQIGSYFPPRFPHFHFYFCYLLNVWRAYYIIFVITLGLWFYIRASFGICYGKGNDLALFREDLKFGCISTPCVCLGRRRMALHIVGKVSPLSWRLDTNNHPGVEKLQYIKARWLSLSSCVDDTKHFPDGGSPGAQHPGSGSTLSGFWVRTPSSMAAASGSAGRRGDPSWRRTNPSGVSSHNGSDEGTSASDQM